MALFTLELAAASVVGSVLVNIVDKVTSVGGEESWLATNINRAHLNYYYALLTCLGLINYLYFLAISLAYGPPPGQKLEARREIWLQEVTYFLDYSLYNMYCKRLRNCGFVSCFICEINRLNVDLS